MAQLGQGNTVPPCSVALDMAATMTRLFGMKVPSAWLHELHWRFATNKGTSPGTRLSNRCLAPIAGTSSRLTLT
eukprot:5091119-Amphidinium_carterae.1